MALLFSFISRITTPCEPSAIFTAAMFLAMSLVSRNIPANQVEGDLM